MSAELICLHKGPTPQHDGQWTPQQALVAELEHVKETAALIIVSIGENGKPHVTTTNIDIPYAVTYLRAVTADLEAEFREIIGANEDGDTGPTEQA